MIMSRMYAAASSLSCKRADTTALSLVAPPTCIQPAKYPALSVLASSAAVPASNRPRTTTDGAATQHLPKLYIDSEPFPARQPFTAAEARPIQIGIETPGWKTRYEAPSA
jgi:hypothetical protein